MSRVADLICQFQSEDTHALEDMDKSRKPDIVRELWPFAEDGVVIDFLISVASNEDEFDLARVMAFRVFENKQYRMQSDRTRIAQMIYTVLNRNKEDYLVLQYAALAAAYYMDHVQLKREVDRIMHDKEEECDLRWNAFAAVTRNPSTPQSVDSLRRLLADEEFSKSAARVLSEWGVE